MPAITSPLPQFFDLDGSPLSSGYVYIGTANGNPETSPVTAYWDSALTQPAAQPLRTLNGYIVRGGTPAQVYAAADWSITVKTTAGALVVYAPTAADYALSLSLAGSSGSSQVGFIAAGTGAVPRTMQAKGRETVSVLDFGADGAGADDLAEIQAALNAALPGQSVVFPVTAAGYYDVSDTVYAPHDVSLDMQQPLRYTGSANVPILVIGDQENIGFNQRYRVGVTRQTLNWGSDSAVGIKLINCQYAMIDIFLASKNTIGVLATGDSTGAVTAGARGWAYNDVLLGTIIDNKYGAVLESKGSGVGLGYINENLWRGGNFVCSSGTLTTTSRYGVVIRSADGAYVNNNQNVFLKPCFQIGEPGGGAESVAFWVDDGSLNYVIKGRFESNQYLARFSNVSNRNHVDSGYSDTVLYENIDTASENFVTFATQLSSFAMTQELFSERDLGTICCGVSGTSVMAPGFSWGTSGSATRAAYSGAGVTYTTGAVTIPGTRSIGFYVDCTAAKEFVVRRTGTAGGRVGVVAYDSGGTILSGAGVVYGAVDTALSASVDFGGCYRTGSDTLNPVYFRVGSSVAYVWVFVAGGSASAVLEGIALSTLPQYASIRVYAGFQTNFLYGSATFDASSLVDGAGETTTVTVTGAALGDHAEASFGVSTAGLTVTAAVTAANTVTVRLQNETGGPIDLASTTLRCRVFKQYAPA